MFYLVGKSRRSYWLVHDLFSWHNFCRKANTRSQPLHLIPRGAVEQSCLAVCTSNWRHTYTHTYTRTIRYGTCGSSISHKRWSSAYSLSSLSPNSIMALSRNKYDGAMCDVRCAMCNERYNVKERNPVTNRLGAPCPKIPNDDNV